MKVNIGRRPSGKKYRHPLPQNVYTTSQFGFLQPSLCRELSAQDSAKLRIASLVRLQPLSKPTFGRMFLKQYNAFVPIEELYHPFASMLKGESYRGSGAHYVPTKVPNLPLSFLTLCTYLCSSIRFFTCTDNSLTPNVSMQLDNVQKVTDTNQVATYLLWFKHYLMTYFSYTNDVVNHIFGFFWGSQTTFYTRFDTSPNSDLSFSPDSNDWFLVLPSEDPVAHPESVVVCGRLTDRGRNLRKILIGLGYQTLMNADRKNALPLFAYYKIWFDLFMPQRNITWKDTLAYGILERVEQNNEDLLAPLYSSGRDLLNFIVKELPECYFTESSDYASAHILGTGVGSQTNQFDYLRPTSEQGQQNVSVNSGPGQQPLLQVSAQNPVSQQGLDILKKLYQRVNINTAIGGRIAEFMRTVFGSDYKQDNESNFIGAQSMTIDVEEVINTAETSLGTLGEFAGKGVNSDRGKEFTFTARQQGYLISMFAIIPDTRLCQAVDPNLDHLGRYDFFNPDFDAITLLPTRKMNIFGVSDFIRPNQELSNGFGNIPNYTEYKVSFDRLNGDMSLRSTKTSFLPFTLGKYIDTERVVESTYIENGVEKKRINIGYQNFNLITAGTIWRYIGLYRWLGNFDRVFVNSGVVSQAQDLYSLTGITDMLLGRLDDNFVVYQYVDLSVSGYALPLADSFQTDSFGDHVSVDKV